jgi:hypothetical protein
MRKFLDPEFTVEIQTLKCGCGGIQVEYYDARYKGIRRGCLKSGCNWVES